MPYIPDKLRREILSGDAKVIADTVMNDGELNFAITVLCLYYLMRKPKITYDHLKDIEGTLGEVSKEFSRRVTVPYEKLKIEINGDVKEFLEINKLILEQHELNGK